MTFVFSLMISVFAMFAAQSHARGCGKVESCKFWNPTGSWDTQEQCEQSNWRGAASESHFPAEARRNWVCEYKCHTLNGVIDTLRNKCIPDPGPPDDTYSYPAMAAGRKFYDRGDGRGVTSGRSGGGGRRQYNEYCNSSQEAAGCYNIPSKGGWGYAGCRCPY